MIAREYALAVMVIPCGVFVLPCYHGYVLWCFRTPLLSWVCLVVFSYSLAIMGMPCGVFVLPKIPQGMPMIAREYENTTRHTHDSKGVELPCYHGYALWCFLLPCYHGYVLWCFRTPLLSWVCLVVFSYSLAIMGMPCGVFVDSKGVRRHHQAYP
jgi:hypothetical protein